ncbi:hypothetical protein ACGFZK_08210 [Streptomyces sp. NPDC048257]|uniref:hypothetical protein n=1 Tax=Streptomyces sp. NPDC048257 TaxID=3365526 RepID=UPI0037132571
MNAHGMALAEVTQREMDGWLAANPGTRYEIRDFAVWAARRGHSRELHVPHRPKTDPAGLDEDSHWELLHQCLNDKNLPLEVRAAGAILLLFGQHLTRIAALASQHSSWREDLPRRAQLSGPQMPPPGCWREYRTMASCEVAGALLSAGVWV